jgi:hypothetical protein
MQTMNKDVSFMNYGDLIPNDVVNTDPLGDALSENTESCVRRKIPTIAGFVCTHRSIYGAVVGGRNGQLEPIPQSMVLFYLPEDKVADVDSYYALLDERFHGDLKSYLLKHHVDGIAVCGLQVESDLQFSSARACRFLLSIAWPSIPVMVWKAFSHARSVSDRTFTHGWRLAAGVSMCAIREIYLWPYTPIR